MNFDTDNVFENSLKVFENVKYFKKVFKYKLFSFLKVKHKNKYFEESIKKLLNTSTNVFDPVSGEAIRIFTLKKIHHRTRTSLMKTSSFKIRLLTVTA